MSSSTKQSSSSENNLPLLHKLAMLNRPDLIRSEIDEGVSVDLQDIEGQTALQIAVLYKHCEAMEFLLDNGASVLHKDLRGANLLHMAGYKPPSGLMAGIMANKSYGKKNEDESASLSLINSCNSKIAQSLIKEGVPVDDIASNGITPLCLAVVSENFEVAVALMSVGASVRTKCIDELSIFVKAVSTNNSKIVYEATQYATDPIQYIFDHNNLPEEALKAVIKVEQEGGVGPVIRDLLEKDSISRHDIAEVKECLESQLVGVEMDLVGACGYKAAYYDEIQTAE
jgi:ankyrin repeat protein